MSPGATALTEGSLRVCWTKLSNTMHKESTLKRNTLFQCISRYTLPWLWSRSTARIRIVILSLSKYTYRLRCRWRLERSRLRSRRLRRSRLLECLPIDVVIEQKNEWELDLDAYNGYFTMLAGHEFYIEIAELLTLQSTFSQDAE